jgi:hypothetical protein
MGRLETNQVGEDNIKGGEFADLRIFPRQRNCQRKNVARTALNHDEASSSGK